MILRSSDGTDTSVPSRDVYMPKVEKLTSYCRMYVCLHQHHGTDVSVPSLLRYTCCVLSSLVITFTTVVGPQQQIQPFGSCDIINQSRDHWTRNIMHFKSSGHVVDMTQMDR